MDISTASLKSSRAIRFSELSTIPERVEVIALGRYLLFSPDVIYPL